jgi:hypothetical protein
MEMPSSPDYQQLMQMWLDCAAKMASAGADASTAPAPTDAAKLMRDIYCKALTQYTEQYMRSPAFLEMTRQSTEMAVKFRQQANDFLAEAHHAVGSLARPDVDSLLMAIRRCETRVLDKLDELAIRGNELDQRLEALESSNGKPARKPK